MNILKLVGVFAAIGSIISSAAEFIPKLFEILHTLFAESGKVRNWFNRRRSEPTERRFSVEELAAVVEEAREQGKSIKNHEDTSV